MSLKLNQSILFLKDILKRSAYFCFYSKRKRLERDLKETFLFQEIGFAKNSTNTFSKILIQGRVILFGTTGIYLYIYFLKQRCVMLIFFFSLTECSGKGLKPVLHCNFEYDFCGFTQSGFQWIRTKGKQVINKRPEIPFDGYPPGSNFVYSNSSFSTEVYGKGIKR